MKDGNFVHKFSMGFQFHNLSIHIVKVCIRKLRWHLLIQCNYIYNQPLE